MLTQDMRGMANCEVRAACLCTHKGRLLASLLVVQWGDLVYLITPESHGEALFNQLDRYIIMDDVTLTEVTKDWEFISLQGPGAPEAYARFTGNQETHLSANFATAPFTTSQGQGLAIENTRTGERGIDLMMPAGSTETLETWLAGQEIPMVSNHDSGVQRARIEAGIPSPAQELDDEIIPVEVGLGHTISYTKGCYAGQEVIAKIKYRGEPPKTMVTLNIEGSLDGVDAPLSVWNGEKRVGRVTSRGTSTPENTTPCLALVKTRQIPQLDQVEVKTEELTVGQGALSEEAIVWGSGFPFQL
jgi:folate-binding protein YgfZ